MPSKEIYARLKAEGICVHCGKNPAEEGMSRCGACLEYRREYRKTPQHQEHQREYMRAYRQTPQHQEHQREYMREYRKTPQQQEYRKSRSEQNRKYHREYVNRLYGIYCCYMPQLDQFKLGYGGVHNRLSVYRVTDPNTTIVAYTELDNKTAKREERKILRETIIYNSNGNKNSEMRLNCAPVRQYIKDNFDVINDETILNIRAQKRIVQAKL